MEGSFENNLNKTKNKITKEKQTNERESLNSRQEHK